jgi:two-component system, NarL family, response regulator DegU
MARDDSSGSARVVVTGDYPLIRTAVARLIASEASMDVVGECANECDALAAAMRAVPDVVVMDVDLDSHNGGRPDLVSQLLSRIKPHPALILTRDDSDPPSIAAALAAGAWGIVLKNRSPEVFLRAIQAVVGGEAWLEPATLARVFGPTSRRRSSAMTTSLTRREREIVELVCQGLKNRKIGERLFISETTVRHHLTSIFNKLAVTSRLELMHYSYSGRVARD